MFSDLVSLAHIQMKVSSIGEISNQTVAELVEQVRQIVTSSPEAGNKIFLTFCVFSLHLVFGATPGWNRPHGHCDSHLKGRSCIEAPDGQKESHK